MRKIINLIAIFISLSVNAQIAYYPFQNEEKKWGIIDSNGEVIVEPTLVDEISFFYNHNSQNPVAKYRTANNKYGLINRKGEQLVESQYDKIYPSKSEQIVFLEKDNYANVYNTKLKKTVITNIEKNDFFIQTDQKSINIIDKEKKYVKEYNLKGEIKSERAYSKDDEEESGDIFFDEVIFEEQIDSVDFVNKMKELGINVKISETHVEPYNFAFASKGPFVGIIDGNGNDLLDFTYSRLEFLDRLYVKIYRNITKVPYWKIGLFSLMDKKVVLKTEFDRIENAVEIFRRFEPLM